MTATARTKSVRPRFEPCLPLRFQRIDDTSLQGPVTQHWNPEWPLLPVGLRDVNTLDRTGLPRGPLAVNFHRKGRLGRRGQRPLPVDTRRRASCIALRDPPHADKRVGAGAEHQLLQIADLLDVPSLRRREDPLAQTPYVILSGTPTHGVPHERIVLGSVHHDATARGRSHLLPRFGVQLVPRFRCLGHRVLHRLTRPTSAPFRVGQRPYPAGYPERPLEERSPRPGFPTPFGRRHSLLGPSHSR